MTAQDIKEIIELAQEFDVEITEEELLASEAEKQAKEDMLSDLMDTCLIDI